MKARANKDGFFRSITFTRAEILRAVKAHFKGKPGVADISENTNLVLEFRHGFGRVMISWQDPSAPKRRAETGPGS